MADENKNKKQENVLEGADIMIDLGGPEGNKEEKKDEKQEDTPSQVQPVAVEKDLPAKPAEKAEKVGGIDLGEIQDVSTSAPESVKSSTKEVKTEDPKKKEERVESPTPHVAKELKPLEKAHVKREEKEKRVEVIEKPKSTLLMIFKHATLLVLSLGIVGWTVLSDSNSLREEGFKDFVSLLNAPTAVSVLDDGASKDVTSYPLKAGLVIETGEALKTDLFLSGESLARLDSDTKITIDSIKDSEVSITLEEGSVWVNTLYEPNVVTVKAKHVHITGENSSFVLTYTAGVANLYVNKHHVETAIVHQNEVINKFLVAEGYQAQYYDTKVETQADKLKALFYSKLIKEFNYAKKSLASKEADKWITYNINKDKSYGSTASENASKFILDTGVKQFSLNSFGAKMQVLARNFGESLTFSESKKLDLEMDRVFGNLHDSQYFYLQEDALEGDLRFTLFENQIKDLYTKNLLAQDQIKDRLEREYELLSSFGPGNSLYELKSKFTSLLALSIYKDTQSTFELLTDKVHQTYDAIAYDDKMGEKALDEYFNIYQKVRSRFSGNISSYQGELNQQNILVDHLLNQYSVYYKSDFFANKSLLEGDYLASISDYPTGQEELQRVVSNKISLLSMIKTFVFKEELTIEGAKIAVFHLTKEIQELKKDIRDIAAINELFEKRLSDFSVFLKYLDTPDYSVSTLHGSSPKERFEKFKEIQSQLISFEDVLEELLGEDDEEGLDVNDILNIAEEDLKEAGITKVQFGLFKDSSQSKIPINSATVDGNEFRGTYDWERKLVSNIIVKDKLISEGGIAISKVGSIIERTIGPVEEVVVTDEELAADPLASVKIAAQLFLVEKLSKEGIVAERGKIEIVDFNESVYKVERVYYEDNPTVEFSFTYFSKEEKVTDIEIIAGKEVQRLDDTFSLSLLHTVIGKFSN